MRTPRGLLALWALATLGAPMSAYAHPASPSIRGSVLVPPGFGAVEAVHIDELLDLSRYGTGTHLKFVEFSVGLPGGGMRRWTAWAPSDNLFRPGEAHPLYRSATFVNGAPVPFVVQGNSGHGYIADILGQQMVLDEARKGAGTLVRSYGLAHPHWAYEPHANGFHSFNPLTTAPQTGAILAGGVTITPERGVRFHFTSGVNRELWTDYTFPNEPVPADMRQMPQLFRPGFEASVMRQIWRLPDGTRVSAAGRPLPMVANATPGGRPLTALTGARANTLAMARADLRAGRGLTPYVQARAAIGRLRGMGYTGRSARAAAVRVLLGL